MPCFNSSVQIQSQMCFVLTDVICVMTGIWAAAKAPMLAELEVQALIWEVEAVLNSPLLGRAAEGNQNHRRMQVREPATNPVGGFLILSKV